MRIAAASTAILLMTLGSCGESVRKPDTSSMKTTIIGSLDVPNTLAGASIGQPKTELVKAGLIVPDSAHESAEHHIGFGKGRTSDIDPSSSSTNQKESRSYYSSQSDKLRVTWEITTTARFRDITVDDKYAIRRYGKPRLIGRNGRSTYLLYTDEAIGDWEKKYAMTRACMRPPECADEVGTHCSDPENIFRKRTMMVHILGGRQMTVALADPSLLPVYPIIKPLPKKSCAEVEPFYER